MFLTRAILFVSGFVLLSGCAHRVLIESDPPGASVRIGQKMVGVTPTEVKVTWLPFKEIPVSVNLPGRRTIILDLQQDLNMATVGWQAATFQFGKISGNVSRGVHRAQFVRHHGPAGTWAPEEVR